MPKGDYLLRSQYFPDDLRFSLLGCAAADRVKLPAMIEKALSFYVKVVRSPGMEAATKDNGTSSEEVIKILADAYARGDVKID